MPSTVIFSLAIELALILLTLLLLIQPKAFFRKKHDKPYTLLHWVGIVLLCLTFCWSVIVGIVLSMNELSFRI